MMRTERGSVAINVLVVLLIAVSCVLLYLMAHNRTAPQGRTVGVMSPSREQAAVVPSGKVFLDGLPRVADEVSEYALDEFGAGTSRIEVFMQDLDDDGNADRITRTRVENGTDHYSDVYTIELWRDGEYIDITPPEFYTVEGAECSLSKIHFSFRPDFQVVKISRPWEESWDTPTLAQKTVYAIADGELGIIQQEPLKYLCNVADLF